MKAALSLVLATTALAIVPAAPACAQDSATTVEDELKAMRAQMETMAQRIEELEARLGEQPGTPTGPVAPSNAPASAPVPAPFPESPAGQTSVPAATQIAWKGAPQFDGAGGWSFKPRGRIQIDAGFVDAPESTGVDTGFAKEIRRARLGMGGTVPGGFGYRLEVDFAASDVQVVDAFLTYDDDRLVVTVGQHNTFQTLAELTSSNFEPFIERAAFTDAFEFQRRVGVSAQYLLTDAIVQGGVFTDNILDLPSDNVSVDGRAAWFPILADGTRLHLGGSAHYNDVGAGGTVRYRQRPDVHFTTLRFVDTGVLPAASEFGLGLETAVIRGPFHAHAEGFWQSVDLPGANDDPTFFGGFAEAGYFLTPGDTRGYKAGIFDRVRPVSPVDEGGIGAIQIVARYDYLDLVDGPVVGGTQEGLILGLNWAPTDFTRLVVSYAMLHVDNSVIVTATGDRSFAVDTLGVRAQVDF